jgi:hypothetical protein
MAVRKRECTVNLGSTRSHCVENWLWKRLWTCRKTDCGTNDDDDDDDDDDNNNLSSVVPILGRLNLFEINV